MRLPDLLWITGFGIGLGMMAVAFWLALTEPDYPPPYDARAVVEGP